MRGHLRPGSPRQLGAKPVGEKRCVHGCAGGKGRADGGFLQKVLTTLGLPPRGRWPAESSFFSRGWRPNVSSSYDGEAAEEGGSCLGAGHHVDEDRVVQERLRQDLGHEGLWSSLIGTTSSGASVTPDSQVELREQRAGLGSRTQVEAGADGTVATKPLPIRLDLASPKVLPTRPMANLWSERGREPVRLSAAGDTAARATNRRQSLNASHEEISDG